MRLPRWSALLALPVLVGAALLMHGMEAGASAPAVASASTTTAVEPHAHDEHASPVGHDDGACDHCASHVMAACVAVLATVTALRASGRSLRTASVVRTAGEVPAPSRRVLAEVLRPPDPAWVRLAVMRC